jgi:hypothetical protein
VGTFRHRGGGILGRRKGGRAISEFGKIDRILSEMLGLGIAAGTGVLGYILKITADDLGAEQNSPDQ